MLHINCVFFCFLIVDLQAGNEQFGAHQQEGSPGRGSEEESDDDERNRRRDKRRKRKKRRRDEKDRHDKHDRVCSISTEKHWKTLKFISCQGISCMLQILLQKKRKKPSKYVDHDNVNDYPNQESGGWKGYHSPPGPYDSPRGDSDPYEDYYGSPNRRQRGGYQGDKSPSGPYESPYDSPPGPYDSPEDDDGPPRSKKR